MPKIDSRPLDFRADVVPSQGEAFLISVPDAEHLALQSGFVRNQLEAETLREIEARIRCAKLLNRLPCPTGDDEVASGLREMDAGRQSKRWVRCSALISIRT
jgi:hypothetical protein